MTKYLVNLDEIAQELSGLPPHGLKDFLDRYLTPDEIRSLVLRWEITKRAQHGDNRREIAADLRVSSATVSRWALEEWRWRWEA